MSAVAWTIARLAFIALFAIEIARMPTGIPSPRPDPTLWVFVPVALAFFAWRVCSILRRRFEKKNGKDDWTASLWSSPILKNPESLWFIGGLTFVAAAIGAYMTFSGDSGHELVLMATTVGAGSLCGWALFRFRIKPRANQSLDTNALSRQ